MLDNVLEKKLGYKKLALITIVTTIIGFLLSFISSFMQDNVNIINIIIESLVNFVVNGSFYILLYLFFVLKKKNNNMNILNSLLLVNSIMTSLVYLVNQIIELVSIYSVTLSIMGTVKFQILFSLIINSLFYIVEIIMIYGIFAKKKMPYKVFLIISLICIFSSLISFGITLFTYFKYSNYIPNFVLYIVFSIVNVIVGIINSCSFILFIYLYGKNINNGNIKDNFLK